MPFFLALCLIPHTRRPDFLWSLHIFDIHIETECNQNPNPNRPLLPVYRDYSLIYISVVFCYQQNAKGVSFKQHVNSRSTGILRKYEIIREIAH